MTREQDQSDQVLADLLRALVTWSLPPTESYRELDDLTARVGQACGDDTIRDLPVDPGRRRERLIDIVEDAMERG